MGCASPKTTRCCSARDDALEGLLEGRLFKGNTLMGVSRGIPADAFATIGLCALCLPPPFNGGLGGPEMRAEAAFASPQLTSSLRLSQELKEKDSRWHWGSFRSQEGF